MATVKDTRGHDTPATSTIQFKDTLLGKPTDNQFSPQASKHQLSVSQNRRRRAHTIGGGRYDMKHITVIERLRTRRASLGQSVLLPDEIGNEADNTSKGRNRRRRSWTITGSQNIDSLRGGIQAGSDVMGEILGMDDNNTTEETIIDEDVNDVNKGEEEEESTESDEDEEEEEEELPAGQRRVSAASIDSSNIPSHKTSITWAQRITAFRGVDDSNGGKVSNIRKTIRDGMGKYADPTRLFGSNVLKLSDLRDSTILTDKLDKALEIKKSILAAAWRYWIRLSITSYGIFILYRLPLLLQVPIDILFIYCPREVGQQQQEEEVLFCGGYPGLLEYGPRYHAVIVISVWLLSYIYVWYQSSRYLKPLFIDKVSRSALLPCLSFLSGVLGTRQVPAPARSNQILDPAVLVDVATLIHLVVGLPICLLSDIIIFLRWPFSIIQHSYFADYERMRSISFSLLASPIVLISQIIVIARYTSDSTSNSPSSVPMILWCGATLTSIFIISNILSLRYIQTTEGISIKQTISEVCTLSINPNVPPFVRALRSHPRIDYRSSGIFNDTQIRQIAEFFKRNTTLSQIRFSENNRITPQGATLLAEAVWDNVKHNINVGAPLLSTLRTFNSIDIVDILSYSEAVLSPDPIRIPLQILPEDEAKRISVDDISCLEGCPFASTAWNFEDPAVRVMFDASGIFAFTLMRRNAQLLEVDVGSNRLTDACVDSLMDLLIACERLEYLDISCNYFTHNGIAYISDTIATHGRLRSVRVSSVLLDLDYLKRRPTLDLSIGAVYHGAIKRCGAKLKHMALCCGLGIKQLDIDYPSLEEYELALIRMITIDYTLARDWFRSQPIVIQQLTLQRVMKELGHCEADDPRSLLDLTEEIALARNPPKQSRPVKLYEKQLSKAILTASDAMIIASCLSNCNTTLTGLSLRGQFIGVEGAVAIIDAVTYLGCVETLDIAFNEISSADEEGIKESKEGEEELMNTHTYPNDFNRGGGGGTKCNSGSAVTDALIDALVSTQSLKIIDITGNLAFYPHIDDINRTAHAGGITKVSIH